MVTRRFGFIALTAALAMLLISPSAVGAQDADEKDKEATAKDPSLEDMRSHRQSMRDQLMVPSLKGIRGLAYGVAGSYPDGLELHKAMEHRLKQLPILIKRYEDLEPGVTKPIDGVLQLKCLSAGPRNALVELSLTQWCTLTRDPSIDARTITYTDQVVTHRTQIKEATIHLINQFIIDFQKSNSGVKTSAPAAPAKTEASDEQPKKKKSKKS